MCIDKEKAACSLQLSAVCFCPENTSSRNTPGDTEIIHRWQSCTALHNSVDSFFVTNALKKDFTLGWKLVSQVPFLKPQKIMRPHQLTFSKCTSLLVKPNHRNYPSLFVSPWLNLWCFPPKNHFVLSGSLRSSRKERTLISPPHQEVLHCFRNSVWIEIQLEPFSPVSSLLVAPCL